MQVSDQSSLTSLYLTSFFISLDTLDSLDTSLSKFVGNDSKSRNGGNDFGRFMKG